MLGEKLWVDLAVPTGVWVQGDPCPGKGEGVWREQWQGVLPRGDAVEC